MHFLLLSWATGEIRTPAVIGNHMVLQQNHPNPIWGWDKPGQSIEVTISGQNHKAVANSKGYWRVVLSPMKSSNSPKEMIIQGSADLKYKNILVGEVWLCSGQSNMGWGLGQADDSDLESMSAKLPNLRLISVPQLGTQKPQDDFIGKWEQTTPESVINFSAIGYLFGRRLHQVLDVPVGLIDNAWGGSACEAWIPRHRLNQLAVAKPYLETWRKTEAEFDFEKLQVAYEKNMKAWKAKASVRKEGIALKRKPRAPRNQLTGQHRPANLYNGMLNPIIGYGIKGAIWYQGESNTGRGHAYREVFPLMIQSWRDAWQQGDFPFYWVQLADYMNEAPEPSTEQTWPELREAQTFTLNKLKNVGEAVIIDVGEGRNIHPRNKQIVANRLVRSALAKDYGREIPHQSPRYQSMEIKGNKIILTFDHVGEGLYCFDIPEAKGFAICGEDQDFVWAKAKLLGRGKVEVWAQSIKKPIAVRYGWADNPVCNLYRRDGSVTLPMTPFRTDDFAMITFGQ
ncbi:MAG: sialate O-acetylesterase [Opitutales bacterium]|nr:sialate O-acetylesterase [Opitutales bacterium]